MRVLVVDDEAPLCEVFDEFLRRLGHHPMIAHTAEAALAALETERPDVILLDIFLPGMSGLEFLQRPLTRDIPVVVISGLASESQARESLRLGAFDFIGKPVSLGRLQEVLASLDPGAPATPVAAELADRRRAPRAGVALPVRVVGTNGVAWEGTSVDLSVSGIRVRPHVDVPRAFSATLALDLPDTDERLELSSVLVRVDPDEHAFHFVGLGGAERERLGGLVEGSQAPGSTLVAPHLRILHTIAEAVSRRLDVDEMLRVALDALTHVTGHEISSLHLLSPDGQTLHLHGDRGLRPQLREVNRVLRVGEGLIGRVAARGETLHIRDVTAAPDLLPEARETVLREGIRGFVCVPIESRGRILGTLSLGRRASTAFTDAEIALVEASANQIGLALEHGRLYAETRQRIEELRQAETQLVEDARLSTVGKLAAGLAHEINNPLATILAQAELLLTRSEQSDEGRRRLRAIIEETSRAAKLVQNLLHLARRQSPERRPCALSEQVRFVLELKAHELRRDGIEVVTEFSQVPPLWVDESQIRQVVLNLVQNAHQAMAGQASPRVLTVRTVPGDGQARIEILDTGPGIPADALPRIFDAFFTTKSSGEGTGLGLWVSYSIVEQHGGHLRAENRPDGGAMFVVELPLGRRP